MAKIIDKIVKSQTAPTQTNVLWDDGENLKIYRNGVWENTNSTEIKEGSIPLSALKETPYAYPVDTLDGKENKVVGLGGDAMYYYVGELVASEFVTPTEEKVVGEANMTEYLYQPIYNGKYFATFESYVQEKYITLYIGNDVDGYTSNKVYISEDANNLTYCNFNFIPTFGPRSLEVAISPDYVLHCRNYWHYANKNSKVFFANCKQQLDVNLIPKEIARKEDVIKAFDNYKYPTVTVDADALTYEGNIGAEIIRIDINIHNGHFEDNILYKLQEDNDSFLYANQNITMNFHKKGNRVAVIDLKIPMFTTYDLNSYDYKNCTFYNGQCNVMYNEIYYPATIDSADFVTTLINGKYIKYKLNRETHLLELQSELDLNSVESRLAELEAKVGTL